MKGEHGKAREIADRLVRATPDGRAHYARALANFGLKRKADELADIEAALRSSPENANLRQRQAKSKGMA